ncbi:hypothetical protein CM49_01171 [Paenibacillus sp. P1XP2]|jgi:hypothetical protein|nr:hypothetical protein CM49_01171 [Paenibacillus sp. P1XP2]
MDELTVAPPKKRKLWIWIPISVLCICVLGAIGLFSYQKYESYSVARDYEEQFSALQQKAKTFADKINSTPDESLSFPELVDYYQKLKKENTFEDQLKDLNNNPKYASVKNKMSADALMMTKASNELNQILGDIDNIQVLLQKNAVLDDDIQVLETSTTTTIGDYDSKVSDLIGQNSQIRDELAGTLVHNYLKHAHNRFLEAITYRGKYLTESRAANDAYVAAIEAGEESERQSRLAQQYIKEGNNSFYFSSAYYNLSDEAYQNASDNNEIVKEKLQQHESHRREAARMLEKYQQLINLTGTPQSEVLVNGATNPNPPNSAVSAAKKDVQVSGDHPAEHIPDITIKAAMVGYLNSAVRATSNYDFSVMEPYLNPSGKAYKEAKDYLGYLQKKGIYEELISSEVTSIQRLSEDRFKAYTRETYNIYYNDGSMKTKSFKSQFILVHTDQGVQVDELLRTDQIK